jgi:hypothetical protein
MVMALGLAFLAAACSKSADGSAGKREWICFEASSCGCNVVKPHEVSGGSDEVEACFDTSCCLLTQSSASDTDASCDCVPDITDCDAEAKSRRSTQVVSQCPPPGEGPESMPSACAAAGENCRQSYLDANHLSGCCGGSICKNNATGVPVCQAATAKEQTLLKECDHAAATRADDTIHLLTPALATSLGTIELGDPQYTLFGVGPGGCLNSLDLTLGDELDCQLRMSFDMLHGVLTLGDFGGDIGGCSGFTGAEPLDGFISGSASDLTASLSFDGIACDGRLIFESYCVDGSFDLKLGGKVGDLTLEDQTITLQGTLCTAEPENECPAP